LLCKCKHNLQYAPQSTAQQSDGRGHFQSKTLWLLFALSNKDEFGWGAEEAEAATKAGAGAGVTQEQEQKQCESNKLHLAAPQRSDGRLLSLRIA
jgi:hypothetical protein